MPLRPAPSPSTPTHLLVVLGSGGHTAEMINMLDRIKNLESRYTHRTYVVSSGDGFSASKAAEYEGKLGGVTSNHKEDGVGTFDIVTIPRARRVHQSLLSTPPSAIQCLLACFAVLRGTHPDRAASKVGYPDIILTNGPGTAVCVVLSAIILRYLGAGNRGQMRTIFVESWARVKSVSLSGKILLPLVDRFLVQWPQIEGMGSKAEFVGTLIS